jgi:hypothetical protein
MMIPAEPASVSSDRAGPFPTLGFTHLQFEALLTAARQSPIHATSRW